jgi:uncharacterized membrane protein
MCREDLPRGRSSCTEQERKPDAKNYDVKASGGAGAEVNPPNTAYPRITEGTQRLEAFSDGVFAISVTLLVMSLAVPLLKDPARDSLANALLHQWPHYLSFFISFINVGIVWANHHEMFRFIKRSNHIFLLINLFLLMFITLMPYSTALLGQYLMEHGNQVPATAFYSGTLLAMAVAFNAVWLYAVKNKLVNEQCNPEAVEFMTRSHLLGPLLFGTAFILAFIWYPASVILDTLASMLFLIPSTDRPIYLPHKEHRTAP